MFYKNYQLQKGQPISANVINNSSGVSTYAYVSPVYQMDGATGWTLIVSVVGAVTGTSPTLTWAVQTSTDGVNFTQVGGNLASLTATLGHQATMYASDTTQTAVTGPFLRVVAVVGGTTPFFPAVFADLVAQAL